MSEIFIASAPISYGAFELTVGIDPNVPDGVGVLNEIQDAGYAGTDLGPVGYYGDGAELADRLAARNLGLAGAYLEFPFSDPDRLDDLVPELLAMLDTFDAVAPNVPGPAPRPTIADAGSDERRARPGQALQRPDLAMDADAWLRFGVGLRRILAMCRDRGYEPTFHHETGTYIEAPSEIEHMMESADIGLCLDTGHFLIGGGDPVKAMRDWGSRINQLHLKDADTSVMAGIVADGAPTPEIWVREAFPRLGAGDLDVEGVLEEAARQDFSGWLVVEQDIMPSSAERFAQAADDQRTNRTYLSARGL